MSLFSVKRLRTSVYTAKKTALSADHRLLIMVPLMIILSGHSSRASWKICFKYEVNNNGDRTHFWRNPLSIGILSVNRQFPLTAADWLQYKLGLIVHDFRQVRLY